MPPLRGPLLLRRVDPGHFPVLTLCKYSASNLARRSFLNLCAHSSKLPELAAAPPQKLAGRDPLKWNRITPGKQRDYGLMWAVTEVAPLSPPMIRVAYTVF